MRLTSSTKKDLEKECITLQKKYGIPLLLITEPENDEQLNILMNILFEKYKRNSEKKKQGVLMTA